MPQHWLQRGVNVDLQPLNAMTQPAMHPTSCPNNQAPNIMTQQQKRCRCATLTNGFLGFAVLCYAPPRFTRNDDDGAPLWGAGWHAHARVGMS